MDGKVLNKILISIVVLFIIQGIISIVLFNFWLKGSIKSIERETYLSVKKQKLKGLKELVDVEYARINNAYKKSKDIEFLKEKTARGLKEILNGVASQISHLLRKYKDKPRSFIEEKVKELVKNFRYGDGNYIWINDLNSVIVMHPIKPQLDGRDMSNFKDKKGNYFFKEIIRVCKEKGEGMVSYFWPKPGEKEAKLKVSYVKLIPELGWIVGTGKWVEDITSQVQKEVLDEISSMRLETGNYFWINDLKGVTLAHPNKKLIGKSLINLTDTRGNKIIQQMIDIAKQKGDGFLEYYWGKKGEKGDFLKVAYVKLFKPWGWVIGMGVYLDEVKNIAKAQSSSIKKAIDSSIWISSVIVFVFILAVGFVLWFMFNRLLKSPVEELVRFSSKVEEGEYEYEMKGKFKGEFLTLKKSLEMMVKSLREKIKEAELKEEEALKAKEEAEKALREAEEARKRADGARMEGILELAKNIEDILDNLTSASQELSAQAEETSRGAEVQSERVSETATAMEEMNSTILEMAKNASGAAEGANNAKDKAVMGSESVKGLVDAISNVQMMSERLRGHMNELGEKTDRIGEVITVISDIADQTNLLALNAAIEAARAGEHGRGFAVVADEVRKLAEKTLQATKEVAEAIKEIQGSTRDNIKNVEETGRVIDEVTELAKRSGEALDEIVRDVERTADQIQAIATATEEQSSASEEINKSLSEINEISKDMVETMKQSQQAINELVGLAEKLKQIVENMRNQ